MRTVLHCDLNCFYASCEMAVEPELKGRAVAVCGNPEKRHGIILAKSELAKRAGVQTGDAVWQAKQKCPDLILRPPHFDLYTAFSQRVYALYTEYTDRVESFGMDECWLDVTGSKRLFGDGETIANTLRQRVKDEIGLTLSVGVAWNKVFAKLGSDMKKPDATTIITPENFHEKVWPLPAGDLFMVGRKTAEKLKTLNIYTIGDLAAADEYTLVRHFGIIGPAMKRHANGEDDSEVMLSSETHELKSVGHGTTMPADAKTEEELKPVIYALAEMVSTRMRKHGFYAGGVQLTVKDSELHNLNRQRVLITPTDTASELAEVALDLFRKNYDLKTMLPVRMITISGYNLTTAEQGRQMGFFTEKDEKQSRLEHSIDGLREKYGYSVMKRGVVLNSFFCDNLVSGEEEVSIPFKRQ